MDFFDLLKHLLPKARAWNVTVQKTLRSFLQGLFSALGPTIKAFFDQIWLDIFPQSTRQLDKWEDQLGLPTTNITEQQRRDRLEGTWQALGGQDPKYIQDTLQASGFDVYVHDPWVLPRPEPSGMPTYYSPLNYLSSGGGGMVPYIMECGEVDAECGEPRAQAGDTDVLVGYPLVNKVSYSVEDFVVLCGEPTAECGEVGAEAGNYNGFVLQPREYTIPTDPATFPYYLYICGENFGDTATVQTTRRDEFEELCLKLCPTHIWIGIIVTYN